MSRDKLPHDVFLSGVTEAGKQDTSSLAAKSSSKVEGGNQDRPKPESCNQTAPKHQAVGNLDALPVLVWVEAALHKEGIDETKDDQEPKK